MVMKNFGPPFRFLIGLALCLGFATFQENCFSATQSTSVRGQDSTRPPPALPQTVTNCPFSYQDTFYSTDSGTSPPSANYQGYGGGNYPGYYGQIVQLKFNNYGNPYPATAYRVGYGSPTQYTPSVPCDGYYEVTFTVDIRNNSGTGCNYGENSMAIWVSTTDSVSTSGHPASPNAYGCPISYVDSLGHAQTSPSAYTSYARACATFTQWVQCAWTNNFTNESGYTDFQYYGVQAFPIYMYSPTWPYQRQNRIHSQYPGMCYEYTGDPRWASYYYQYYGCWENPGQFQNSYQTAFCSQKP